MKILIKDQSGTTQYTHDVHVPFGSDKKSKSATPLSTMVSVSTVQPSEVSM